MSEGTANAGASRLLIVDAHAYAYRAYHAIRHLSSPQGEPTNAIYGFIKSLGRMRTVLSPTHLVVIWDGGLATERLALLPEYKSHRPSMPEPLERQIGQIELFLEASRIVSWCRDGVEADDWIASTAIAASESDAEVVIASSDKDFLQLVAERVGILNPGDKTEKVWKAEEVRGRTGVEPGQMVDWLSLVGDAVDNIPGVSGVGTKTAARILQQVGSLDAFFAQPTLLASEKLRAELLRAEPVLRRNRELVRLRSDLREGFCLSELKVRSPDPEALGRLYERWGFRTLLAELGGSRQLLQQSLL